MVAVVAFFSGMCIAIDTGDPVDLGPFLNGLCMGIYNFLNTVWHYFQPNFEKMSIFSNIIFIIAYLLGLVLLIGSIVNSIGGVCTAIDILTGHMGDGHETHYHDYYDVTYKDDKINISQGETYSTTKAGWLRRLMFFTYLIWSIPAYIIYVRKYKRWKKNK